jgi:hypothetical protein
MRKLILTTLLAASSLTGAAQPVFSQTEAVAADPAKQKLAETMAGKIIPPGSYEKMMKDMSTQMADTIIAQTLGMDASTFEMAKEGDTSVTDGKTVGELAAEADPDFKERMDIMMRVTFDEMGKLMSAMEPAARGALANVYARKYTAAQLTDMNGFFATPSGSAFAADFMSTFTDKEMMTAMMGEMPKVMEAMPEIMKKVEAATAHLPPAPKSEMALTDGALSACAVDGDTSDCTEADWAANAAGAAADTAAEGAIAAAEVVLQRAEWSKADLKAVEKAEDELDAAYEKSSAAEIKASAAVEKAMRNAGQWTDDVMASEDIPADALPPTALPR